MTHPRSEIQARVLAGRPLDHIPVFDVHGHLGVQSDYYPVPRHTPAEIAVHMDRFGVDHLVVFSIGVTTDPAPANRYHYAATRELPARFSALTMLHAGFPQDWESLIEEGGRDGARGIKLISNYQGVKEPTIDWSPALDLIGRRRGVVLNHNWGGPDLLDGYARDFPDVTFIIGHASLAYGRVLAERGNVYQCTCAAFAYGFASVEQMVDALPVEKILHGSDAIDLDFGTSIGPIAFARIPESDREKILGGNARTLLRRLGWKGVAGL